MKNTDSFCSHNGPVGEKAMTHLVVRQVTIGICTFKRPAGLRSLLESIGRLRQVDTASCEVVVVDNDASGSARSVFDELSATLSLRARYFVEAQRGVGHARNRVVKEASQPWIAFIDDDEQAGEDWLLSLFATKERARADAVLGPVIPCPVTEIPPWLRNSGLLERPRFRTGEEVHWGNGRTGNLLVSRARITAAGGFDPKFSRTGGEDTRLFAKLASDPPFSLVWCDEAIVSETVPSDRMSLRYLLGRSFEGGRTMVRVLAAQRGWSQYCYWAARALIAIPFKAGRLLLLSLTANPAAARAAMAVAGDLGKLTSVFNQPARYGQD